MAKKGARSDAILSGVVRYVGTPCKQCGCSVKYTYNGGCVDCAKRRCDADRIRIKQIRAGVQM